MRFDANVSVSAGKELGTRAEIKNLNSFGALESAVNYEIQRQTDILEEGGKINQETRGWDDAKKMTVSQRSKEESHDYRYFPEPDLPPLTKDGFDIEKLRLEIPELPDAKRKRFGEQFGLSLEQMSVLIQDREMSNYFEQAVSELEADLQKEASVERVKLTLNYLTSDIKGALMTKGISLNQSKLTAENLADLVDMIFKKEISSRVAKDLIVRMIDTGLDPREIVKNEGLSQISDEAGLNELVAKIIKENPKPVEDYKKGKEQAIMFLIGKAMAALKGRSNPEVLKKLFKEAIK
jgi:aspartyl-tRNA(Asn)/glutamyl-tRNA(Gln) amidotransferase subunit B